MKTALPYSGSPLMAVGPDGSATVRSGNRLARYLPNGSLDAGFGGSGYVALPRTIDGLGFLPGPIAVDGDNRILLFGAATDPSRSFTDPETLTSTPASEIVVLRFAADGQLDPSFGDRSGYIRSGFAVASEFDTQLPLVRPGGVALDAEGRPVFSVLSAGLTQFCNLGHSGITWYPRAVVRLTSAGRVDTAFGGGDGVTPISGSGAGSTALGTPPVAVDGGGGIAAQVGVRQCGGSAVFRLGADGSPLSSFGDGGSKTYPDLTLGAVEPAGALLLQRSKGLRTAAVARTTVDGNLDPAFGDGGFARVKMPAGADRTLQTVGVDARGRILLVGSLQRPPAKQRAFGHPAQSNPGKKRPERSFLAIARLSSSGKPDLGFGKSGWMLTQITRPHDISVDGAALDQAGRLVVAIGSGSAGQPPGTRLVLARYLLGS